MSPAAHTQLRRLLAALVVATALLVLFVLPAELGIDPLGTGDALGLTGLADPPQEVVDVRDGPWTEDRFTLVLAPWESAEVKYATADSTTLLWGWHADSPVHFEFHGEPEGGPAGFAETWHVGEADTDHGTARLPFAGRHGWFFENRSVQTVTVELRAAGFFSHRLVYRDGLVDETDLAPQ